VGDGDDTGEAPSSVRIEGRVRQALPGALYDVELEARGRARVTAHVDPKAGLLRVLPGEAVVVELAFLDASRGRIVRRA
jgi:translation initiation factor IF-1